MISSLNASLVFEKHEVNFSMFIVYTDFDFDCETEHLSKY